MNGPLPIQPVQQAMTKWLSACSTVPLLQINKYKDALLKLAFLSPVGFSLKDNPRAAGRGPLKLFLSSAGRGVASTP